MGQLRGISPVPAEKELGGEVFLLFGGGGGPLLKSSGMQAIEQLEAAAGFDDLLTLVCDFCFASALALIEIPDAAADIEAIGVETFQIDGGERLLGEYLPLGCGEVFLYLAFL